MREIVSLFNCDLSHWFFFSSNGLTKQHKRAQHHSKNSKIQNKGPQWHFGKYKQLCLRVFFGRKRLQFNSQWLSQKKKKTWA